MREFLRRLEARDTPVVIAEGHYHPHFYKEDAPLTVYVRERLAEFAADSPSVTYMSLRDVMIFDAEHYEDDVHTNHDAGLAFSERLVGLLRRK